MHTRGRLEFGFHHVHVQGTTHAHAGQTREVDGQS